MKLAYTKIGVGQFQIFCRPIFTPQKKGSPIFKPGVGQFSCLDVGQFSTLGVGQFMCPQKIVPQMTAPGSFQI